MDGDEAAALRAQIAALTAAVNLLAAKPKSEPTITVAALFAEFDMAHAGVKSWETNRYRLLPLVERLGMMPAAQLTPLKWAEHAAVRAATRNSFGRLPKPHLIGVELGRAKELLKFGVANGFLETNPLALAKRPKTISARETWLEEDSVQALLEGVSAVPGERNQLLMRAFILLCLDGMLRFEEARNLRRDRIKNGVIELSAKSTKSKRRRTIGLTPRVLEAIADVPPVIGDPRVFVNPNRGRLYGPTTLRVWFRVACEASGVDALAADGERVVIHTLRHSGASAADARGASPMAIRDCLGHTSLAITERYLHRHRESGAQDLARLMAEGSEKERRGPKSVPVDTEHKVTSTR